MKRRLSAILATDVIGYSRLIGIDESATLEGMRSLRIDVLEPIIEQAGGRVVKLMGDGLLAEFPSVVDAVSVAFEIQKETANHVAAMPEDRRIALRIGINVGDIVVEDDGDIYGDGINIAARLQEVAPASGIALSEAVHRELRGKLDIEFEDAGPQNLKNIAVPVHTWLWPVSEGAGARTNAFVFDPFIIDVDAGLIRINGEAIHVEPQVFDLITLLCSNPGRLLGHDEIIEKVWNGRIVSDSAIASRINAARKALGDDGQRQEIIKTVRGKGFRFELTPTSGTIAAAIMSDAAGGGEKFVLSCTPYAYSLLMTTRSEGSGSQHYKALPTFLAEAAVANKGVTDMANLAIFDNGADVLNCAVTLIQTIDNRCRSLPQSERWAAKIGIGFGTLNNGFAHALAGRMDAFAEPGGICATKRALDMLDEGFSVEIEALVDGEDLDDSGVYKVKSVGDWQSTTVKAKGPSQLATLDLPQSDEVSIVVLPFEVSSNDEELAEVAIGLRLEIQNALVQLSSVLPIAAGSAAAFVGRTSAESAQSLGVRYVIQGNVRAVGRKVRLMLELYDQTRDGVTWSRSYSGSLDDGFEFQDEMTTRVVRAIDVKVLSGEQARIWHKSFSDLKAIRLQYRGMQNFFKMSKESMRSALENFELLYEMHPEVSIGATWAALCNWFDLQRGWTDDRKASSVAVEKWANIAIAMPEADGQAHTALCHLHILNRDYDKAEKIGEEAVTVRPSCANANGFFAHALYFCGSLEKAIHHAKLAIRFSPAYPPMFAAVLAGAYHAIGDHETAIAIAKEGQRINPNDKHTGIILCSALIDVGRDDEARLVAVNLLRSDPSFDVDAFINNLPFQNREMGRQLATNCVGCFGGLN